MKNASAEARLTELAKTDHNAKVLLGILNRDPKVLKANADAVAALPAITYYACAATPEGRIGQILVTRKGGRQVSQEWTGVTYPQTRAGAKAAEMDMARLNA